MLIEEAEFVDALISSLDQPSKELDQLWENEAELRLETYKKGEQSSY